MTPRLRQALEAWAGDGFYTQPPSGLVIRKLYAAFEAEPDDEPRFRVGDRVRATDPCNAGELGTVVGWRVRWDCDCKATIALGDLEPAPPDPEPFPCETCGHSFCSSCCNPLVKGQFTHVFDYEDVCDACQKPEPNERLDRIEERLKKLEEYNG